MANGNTAETTRMITVKWEIYKTYYIIVILLFVTLSVVVIDMYIYIICIYIYIDDCSQKIMINKTILSVTITALDIISI